jgi:tripartite-type tricarboxylate transporter receptor subunit TctC
VIELRKSGALLCILVLSGVAALPRAAGAEPVADFYKGKTVTIYCGYTAGGTYDAIARLVSRYIGPHIPGKPTFIVKNMPGSGSLKAVLYLYDVAPKDGTALGVVTRTYPTEPVFNASKPKYDPAKFEPIGSTSSEVSVGVTWHTSPFKTFADLMTRQATVGATSVTDDIGRHPLIARNLTGAKIKLVLGYPGGNEITTALEKGEVDARFGWSWGSVKSRAKSWLDEKKINILIQEGMAKAPDLPNVPFIMDYAKTDLDRAALEFLFAPQAAAWPLLAPPGLPPERIAALRTAYKATMTDPGFVAAAKKLRIDIEPISGEEMKRLNGRIAKADGKVIARAKELIAAR